MRYEVEVRDEVGRTVVAATLNCSDSQTARRKFAALPLPAGRAELRRGAAILTVREVAPVAGEGRSFRPASTAARPAVRVTALS